MANLNETPTFDEGVYQLELTDPVIGGPNGISNQPLKNLANRTRYLKDALDALLAGAPADLNTLAELAAALAIKAPIASPAFTGNPTAPTPSVGDSDTSIATTGFVAAAVAAGAQDLSAYATKDSPTFTGNPTAPTPTQFDNDTSLATTEFVQRALGSMRAATGFSANTTLTAAHIGQLVQCASVGPYTITLPSVSGVPDGAAIELVSSASGTITIARQGSDVIYPNLGPGQASITLGNGDTAKLVKITGGWALIAGSASLRYSNGDYGRSLSANGWQRLPSGLIIQWGNSTGSFTFPIAFPNNVFGVYAQLYWNNSTMTAVNNIVPNPTLTGATWFNGIGAGAGRWFAIGN